MTVNNSVLGKWAQYASDRDEVNFLKRAQEAPAPRGNDWPSITSDKATNIYDEAMAVAEKALERAKAAKKQVEDALERKKRSDDAIAARSADYFQMNEEERAERDEAVERCIQSIKYDRSHGGLPAIHIPKIFDFKEGKERPITQEDVNELLHIRAAYVHLKQKVYESVTESNEIIKSGDVMVNERFDFESKEAEDLWYNDRTEAQDAEREADPNYHDVYQDACDAYNAIISAAAEKQEVHINK